MHCAYRSALHAGYRMKEMHNSRHHNRPAHRFAKHLHLRIWCAVLASLVLAGLLAGAVWKVAGPDMPREIVLSDEAGNQAGRARIVLHEKPGTVRVELSDGKVLYARWAPGWAARAPFGFAGWLLLIVLAVGLGAYPVVRRLTRRLEQLQHGVDALGEGNLAARVAVSGHDEIAWLATRFNHAAARIEALVGTHKALLANASHELRSPLARIRMGLELLDRGDTAKARAEIARDITELDQLIEEILLASRLDSPAAAQEPFEEVDLTALAAEECARAGTDFDASGVVVTRGSPRLLRRLMRNLLENAQRHGGSTKPPTLEASSGEPAPVFAGLRRTAGSIEFMVCDRGPGVPERERERIFDAFYRLQGASEAAGGVGLGLALVRAIARQHGGSAACEAREGGGACFRVTLPS